MPRPARIGVHLRSSTAHRVDERSEVRDAVRRFLMAGLLVLAVVAVPVGLWTRAQAENHALANARQMAERLAQFTVRPVITAEFLAGDPAASLALDQRLQLWLNEGFIVRIKVWDPSGRIIYSDASALIGERFPRPVWGPVLTAEWEGSATLGYQDELDNQFERTKGPLVEVYVPFMSATGQPLVFEAYYDDAAVEQEQEAILLSMAPPLFASLLALQLAQLVPAIRLARRIQRSQIARRRMLQHAVEASDFERRRIARNLHDDVIQDLAGLAFHLEAEEMHGVPGQRKLFGSARSILQANVRRLRAVATELYPPDLDNSTLGEALTRLADALQEHGIEVVMTLPDRVELPHDVKVILYRVARESLANIVKHAGATRVIVRLEATGGTVTLHIDDDGRGFDVTKGSPDGHLGLRLIQDAIREADGALRIEPGPGGGTSVTATVPASIDPDQR
jgi:signal transduction histidine kinase